MTSWSEVKNASWAQFAMLVCQGWLRSKTLSTDCFQKGSGMGGRQRKESFFPPWHWQVLGIWLVEVKLLLPCVSISSYFNASRLAKHGWIQSNGHQLSTFCVHFKWIEAQRCPVTRVHQHSFWWHLSLVGHAICSEYLLNLQPCCQRMVFATVHQSHNCCFALRVHSKQANPQWIE